MSTHPSCAKPRSKRQRTAATSTAESPISAVSSSLSNVNLPPSANEIAISPANAAPTGSPDAAPTLPLPPMDMETGSLVNNGQSETPNSDAVGPANTPPKPDHEHTLIVEERPHTPLDEESHHQTLPHVVDDFSLEAPTMNDAMLVDEPVEVDTQPNDALLRQTTPVPDNYSGTIIQDDILPIPQVDTPPVHQVDTLVNQPIPVLENPVLNEAANPPIQDLVTPDVGKFSANVHEDNSLENGTPPVQDNNHVPEYEITAVDEGKPTEEFIADDSDDIGMSIDGCNDFPGFSGHGEDKGLMGIEGDDHLTDDSESGIKLPWSC